MLDALVDKIDISKVDAIIGIKSGGAFMANYLGKKYNKPYSYIKIKTKDYNYTTNTTTSMYAKIIYKNKWNYEYDIIEKPKIDVNGKNILLVDEIVDTGDTMKEIIKILKSEGTKSIIPMTFFQVVRPRNSKYTKIDGLIQGKEKFICFPWGYDN